MISSHEILSLLHLKSVLLILRLHPKCPQGWENNLKWKRRPTDPDQIQTMKTASRKKLFWYALDFHVLKQLTVYHWLILSGWSSEMPGWGWEDQEGKGPEQRTSEKKDEGGGQASLHNGRNYWSNAIIKKKKKINPIRAVTNSRCRSPFFLPCVVMFYFALKMDL